jgi:hypothetical protein
MGLGVFSLARQRSKRPASLLKSRLVSLKIHQTLGSRTLDRKVRTLVSSASHSGAHLAPEAALRY